MNESREEPAQPIDAEPSAAAAIEALRNGPRGALIVSAVAVGVLFLGWLLFYFLVFMPRGAVG